MITLDKRFLTGYATTLPGEAPAAILNGIDFMMGR